jgi:hypothetical protein
MTIPANTSNRNDYPGNDSLAIFPFNFPIQNQNQVKVWVVNQTTGVWLNGGNADGSLIYDTDYVVAGDGQPGGGTIELVNLAQAWLDANTGFLNTGWNLVIRMFPGLSQPNSVSNGGPFYEDSVENSLDLLTMQDLEQEDDIDRSFKLPPVENPANYILTAPIQSLRAGKVLGFDANGNLCTYALPASIAAPFYSVANQAALPIVAVFSIAETLDTGQMWYYNVAISAWQGVV